PQLAQALALLLEKRGQIVSRAELQDRLWGATNTDRERGLNNAMNRLREALGDSAAQPRWIETVPKRGYRFTPESIPPRIEYRWIRTAFAAAAIILIAALIWTIRPRQWRDSPPSEYWAALNEIRVGGTHELEHARGLLESAIRREPSFAP